MCCFLSVRSPTSVHGGPHRPILQRFQHVYMFISVFSPTWSLADSHPQSQLHQLARFSCDSYQPGHNVLPRKRTKPPNHISLYYCCVTRQLPTVRKGWSAFFYAPKPFPFCSENAEANLGPGFQTLHFPGHLWPPKTEENNLGKKPELTRRKRRRMWNVPSLLVAVTYSWSCELIKNKKAGLWFLVVELLIIK